MEWARLMMRTGGDRRGEGRDCVWSSLGEQKVRLDSRHTTINGIT